MDQGHPAGGADRVLDARLPYEEARTTQGEFEQGTCGGAEGHFGKGERLAKEKLGFSLPAFGPHWSGTTEATDRALEAVPDVKIWLYGPAKPKYFTRLSIERVMALENPTFVPDAEKFKALYEKTAAKKRGARAARASGPVDR